ncbi:MAG: hypothetical protein IIT39_07905 [Clostridia bacterium]|nr:hypothetical protein [Clostridia bacterium]
MSITIKQAYKYAKDILNGFSITNCTELADSWIFYSKDDNLNICLPPIEIFKSGKEADFWLKHREFMNVFEESDWLDKNGKIIPVDELEKTSE